jgi:VWFA-related protein
MSDPVKVGGIFGGVMEAKMIRSAASWALFAILFLSALTPGAAQENTATNKLSARTNLVLVPVVVTDRKGVHIRGLKKDDFEVKEDGKIQSLASFEEISANANPIQRAALPPNAFTNEVTDEHPKELEIIALDLLNTPFASQAQARQGLIEFLSKSVNENSLLALVVFQSNHVRMIHNFTTDRAVLTAAIKKLQGGPTSRDMITNTEVTGDVDTEAAQIESIVTGFGANTNSGSIGQQIAGTRAQSRGIASQFDASRERQAGMETLECLQQVAQYFSAVPGRKSLIWASTGFRFAFGSTTGDFVRGSTPADWQQTVHALHDANISVYPVDVGGLITIAPNSQIAVDMPVPGSNNDVRARSSALDAVASGVFEDPIAAKHDTMRAMADMTGGEAFYNNNDLENLFRQASADSSQYYVLTYYTAEKGKDGWRKIDVKVHQDGAHVRSRNGFFFTKAVLNPNASQQMEEAMAVRSSLNFTELPIRGMWQQIEPDGKNRKVHFILSVPPGAVTIDTDHGNHLSLDFLIVATNTQGQEAGKISQRVERQLPPAGASQIQANGITYPNVLTLPPGEYSVHLAVRDNITGKIGSVVVPLKVE